MSLSTKTYFEYNDIHTNPNEMWLLFLWKRGKSAWIFLDSSYEGLSISFVVEEYQLHVHKIDVPRTLQWRHNERNGVSNHRRLDCLSNRLFMRKAKKSSKLPVTDLCKGNPPVSGGFPHKGPVTREMFPFDDVIMKTISSVTY